MLTDSNAWILTSLRLCRPSITNRLQHFADRTATHLVVDDPWSCRWLSFMRTSRGLSQPSTRPLARHRYMLCRQYDHDGHHRHRRGIFCSSPNRYRQRLLPSLRPTISSRIRSPHLRGLALAIYQWWCSLGTLIGTIVDNFTEPLGGRGLT